jgi:gamma-glutamyl hercynylcysteine S-oxide synthase
MRRAPIGRIVAPIGSKSPRSWEREEGRVLQADLDISRWMQRVVHDDRPVGTGPGTVRPAPAPGRGAPAPHGLFHWCAVPGRIVEVLDDGPDGEVERRVVLTSFELTRVPVTNAQYGAFVEAGGYDDERFWTVYGWRHRRSADWTGPGTREETDPAPDAPVTGVSWWEAMAFARWAGALLPSESQWECAARLGAPVAIDLRPSAVPPASPFACLDMNARVAEWCLDNDGPLPPSPGALVDPVVETAETAPHAARGGCGLHDASSLCGNSRDHYSPAFRDPLIGFRLARPAPRDRPAQAATPPPSTSFPR